MRKYCLRESSSLHEMTHDGNSAILSLYSLCRFRFNDPRLGLVRQSTPDRLRGSDVSTLKTAEHAKVQIECWFFTHHHVVAEFAM